MSANASTPVVAVVVKKVRVPTTLPAKYGKFVQFGYYLMNKLNACDGDEDTPPLVDPQLFLNKLRIFEPLADQQAFVQEFFDSSKNINAELRKMMQQRKRDLAKAAKEAEKPQKEKKPRQPRAKKVVEQSEPVEPAAQPVEKKTRAKKVKVTSTEDALVNELVQLAEGTNGSPLPPPSNNEVKVDSSKKGSAKTAVAQLLTDVQPIADPVKETKPKPVKETKPKPVKETKSAPVKETKPPLPEEKQAASPEEEEEEELQVSVFQYQGKQYLIDDDHNLYDFHSQLKIGTFINSTLSLL